MPVETALAGRQFSGQKDEVEEVGMPFYLILKKERDSRSEVKSTNDKVTVVASREGTMKRPGGRPSLARVGAALSRHCQRTASSNNQRV